MPLLDTLTAFATKYGPTLLQAGSAVLQNSPMGNSTRLQMPGMMPGMGGAPTVAAQRRAMGLPARKKRRGLTASDIRGAQKVARLVQHFGFRPKVKARKGRR